MELCNEKTLLTPLVHPKRPFCVTADKHAESREVATVQGTGGSAYVEDPHKKVIRQYYSSRTSLNRLSKLLAMC